MFGSWGSWFTQAGVLGVIACCIVPCIRMACIQATVIKMSQTAIMVSFGGTKEGTSSIELNKSQGRDFTIYTGQGPNPLSQLSNLPLD